MSSIYALRHKHISVSASVTTAGVMLEGLVVSPFDGAEGKVAVCESATNAGTYTRDGTTVEITSAAHGLQTGDFIWINWDLADGVHEVTYLTENTYSVQVANSGAESGSLAGYYTLVFQVDVVASQVFQIVLPPPGIPSQGLYVGLPANLHASVLYRLSQ